MARAHALLILSPVDPSKLERRLMAAAMPLMAGGAALAALDVALRLFREHQLFEPSPDPERSWSPADYGLDPARVEEVSISSRDNQTLYGWYCRAEEPVASALFCHGNRGNLTVDAPLLPVLVAAGMNVLTFDYRGYGRSSGHASIRGILADAVYAARKHDELRPATLPSILYGNSLGGAIAAQTTKLHRFDGVILQSTFTNLRDMARHTFPNVPMHLLAGSTFDTLEIVRKFDVPLLILHGTSDGVAPCAMAHALYEHCPAPKWIHTVENGEHRNMHLLDRASFESALRDFLREVGRQKSL